MTTLAARPGATPRVPWTLAAWLAIAGAAFALAPSPPPPIAETPEETAAVERSATLAGQRAREWQAEHGDMRIAWDDAKGHLAIVIDDVGRELYHFERLHALRYPLSFSVLPGAVYAPGVQLRLLDDRRRPREILLHLPMEPEASEPMTQAEEATETFLLLSDPPDVLRRKVRDALAAVPHARVVNNHMGSRLTRDRAAMDVVMAELAERRVAFLDSRTVAESVAYDAANAAGIPTTTREIFLDHDPDPHAIEAALDRAADLSRERPVVAIAHPGDAVVDVLQRRLPRLHADGIGLFTVAAVLAHRPSHASPR